MWKLLLAIFLIFSVGVYEAEALSCRAGRGACVASCMAQNCATGYCPSGENGVCVCSRCNNGPAGPW